MDIKKSILCATLSNIAYSDVSDRVRDELKTMGFNHVKFFDKDSAQAYVIHNEKEIFVVFRGTELSDIKDVLYNGMFWPTRGQKQGRVHAGFAYATDHIWNSVNSYLKGEVSTYEMADSVTFTGHSLGGAMAIIGAARSAYVADVYTFGSPRTGNRKYHRNIRSRMYRITNEHDIIPLVLPPIGYHHGGIEYRIHNYSIHEVTSYLDAWKCQCVIGFHKAINFRWVRSLIGDHSILEYIKNLKSIDSKT